MQKSKNTYDWNVSLRKQATFRDAPTGFPVKWCLKNKRRNSILMTHHYPDLGSASNTLVMLCLLWNLLQPIRSTTQSHQFTGKPLVVLWNVVSFLRLLKCWVVTAYNVLCCGVLYICLKMIYCYKSTPTWSLTVVSSDSLMTFNAKSTEKMHEHVLIIL